MSDQMSAPHHFKKSLSSFGRALGALALSACVAVAFTSTSAHQAKADPIAGGIAGAIGGAIIGGAAKGKKGAGRGALIGLGVGVAAGAIAAEEKRKRRAYKKKKYYKKKYVRHEQTYRRAPAYQPEYEQELVYETQLELQRLGYNPGPVDGVYGPQTADALATYQDDYALPITGEPSEDLLIHMQKHEG